MAEWKTMDTASKTDGMWLFLPGSIWGSDDQGRPIDGSIQNEVVKGGWSPNQGCWASVNRIVYPSMWNDAPMSGDPPEPPKL